VPPIETAPPREAAETVTAKLADGDAVIAVYVPGAAPVLRDAVKEPDAAIKVIVTGAPEANVVLLRVTPLGAESVQLPDATEIVVVGSIALGFPLPARVKVNIDEVPLEYPVTTDADDGAATMPEIV
jgi:hypothetical protein